ncbi:MAG TPA: VapE family protein [Candidatus Kapabacteria bacterium]|nr:VapE family protein [Candidatus Kapabacteria bacterium]HPP38691.1 VapE family protein [Candidatus Kapabacteria bacterium]
MRKYQFSINCKIKNKPNKPTASGWKNAEMTADELVAHVKSGFAFSPGVMLQEQSKKPSTKDIAFAELLVVDVDNDIVVDGQKRRKNPEEGYTEFDEIKSDAWLKQNLLFAYTTPSHTLQHHKFRLVFTLPKPISNPDEYKTVARAFITHFGGDLSCSNIDRMFYGNTDAEIFAPNQELNENEFKRIVQFGKVEQKGFHTNRESKLTAEEVAEMLRHIPARMDYTSWFKVVSAVGNHFDIDTAERLINNWSPDDQRGTRWRLAHRGKNVTIATVVWLAKQFGYQKKPRLSTLSVSEEGEIHSTKKLSQMQLAESYLLEYYDFRYDVVKQIAEYKPKHDTEFIQITDRDVNSLVRELEQHNIKVSSTALHNRIDSDFVQARNPIKDYFDNLPTWDKHDYLEDCANLVKVPEKQRRHWYTFFSRWMVATVGCALEMKRHDTNERIINHQCLVLVGEQGIGKTTFINRLVPPELMRYYAIAQINPANKDSKILVTEHFIVNLDELESSTREEMATLKSLMTTEYIVERRSYGRRIERLPRRASFVGSVNKAAFLSDITGNRRFLIVDVLSIDLDKTIDLRQMYAQCLFLLKNEKDGRRFKYWFDGKEIEELNTNNANFLVPSVEEELLVKTFRPFENADAHNADAHNADELKKLEKNDRLRLLSATEIYDALQKQTAARLSMHKIVQFLKKYGYTQKSIKVAPNTTKRAYLVKPCNEEESDNNF